MKYDWNPTREFVIDVTIIVCRSSKLSGHVVMVSHSVATQFFVTYMSVNCLFERLLITTAHFHRFALFKPLLYTFLLFHHTFHKFVSSI